MPTIVDSLVVKLGLDASGFEVGAKQTEKTLTRTKEAAARAGKDMQASGAQAAEFFSQIKNEALGLIGVVLGAAGLTAVVRNATNSMAQLGREARNINIDPSQLAAFSNVIERFGGSAASARQTLFGISQAIENFKITGDPSILKFLNPIGANVEDTPLGIFTKYLQFAQQHKNDPALVNLIGRGLGIDQGAINAALQMKDVATFTREYADALKDVPTKEQTEEAGKLQKAWVELEQAAQGLTNRLTTDLSPAMEGVLGWMKEQIRDEPYVVAAIAGIGAAITTLGGIRISARLMGLTSIASAIDAIFAAASRAIPLTLPLALSGDAGPGPDTPGPHGWDFGGDGSFGRWWGQHAPTWLGGAPGPSASPLTPAETGANAQAARSYFLAQGYTPAQVAGILANIQAESGFNPGAVGDNGQAYGLFQWHPDRQRAFRLWSGHDIRQSTMAEQLAFAQWELTHTEAAAGAALRRSQTRAQAGAAFSLGFERPAGGAATAAQRGALADIYAPPAAGRQVFPGGTGAASITDIHIGSVVVNTKATDAKGIARDISGALVTQANRGLQ